MSKIEGAKHPRNIEPLRNSQFLEPVSLAIADNGALADLLEHPNDGLLGDHLLLGRKYIERRNLMLLPHLHRI
jgi:hypothetical protein